MTRWLIVIVIFVGRGLAVADPEATVEQAPRSPTGYFEIGAAYTPDDGVIVMTEIGQPDLLHSGQGLTLSADVSKIRQHVALRHDLPLGGGLALHTELFARERDYFRFQRSGAGGTVELDQQLGRATHLFLRYGAEQVEISGLSDPASLERRVAEPMAHGDQTGLVSTLGLGVRYDTRDRRWLSGSHLELLGEVAQPWLGSTGSFTRLRAAAGIAHTFGRLTLRLRGHAGYVRSQDAMGVPLSERLFDEGNADVRGYALGSLGNSLGDNYEAIGRAELELAISRKAELAVGLFADAGIRGNLDPMFGPTGSTVSRSAGVSLIFRGVRLDIAFPLDHGRGTQALLNAGFSF